MDLIDIKYDQHSFWSDKEWPRIYEDGGIKYKVLSTKKAFFRRLGLLFQIGKFDRVFIHREATPIGPPWLEWFVAKIFKKPIIYDFDDAIWLPNSSKANEKLVGKFKNHGKTAHICSWAQTVTVGNSFLAEYARQFCNDVRIIPTTIDTENLHNPALYNHPNPETESSNEAWGLSKRSEDPVEAQRRSRRHSGKLEANSLRTIGWTGTHSTLKQLTPLFPTLEVVHKQHPFKFLLIADQPPEQMPTFVEFKKWNKETEIQDLMGIDIGIMPLFDSQWEKGKCGFKALQYLALEIPAIVSGVGVNIEIIKHNQNGLICEPMELEHNTYPSWKTALLELLQNKDKRKSFGLHGRQTIINSYSVRSQVVNYQKVFALKYS